MSHCKFLVASIVRKIGFIAIFSMKNAISNGHTEGATGETMLDVSSRDYMTLFAYQSARPSTGFHRQVLSLKMMHVVHVTELDGLLRSILFLVYLLPFLFASFATGR